MPTASQDISKLDFLHYEQVGSKRKAWYEDPETQQKILFKQNRSFGEDWSEVLSYHLASALGIPCAEYYFAHLGDRLGVATPNITPPETSLFLGNQVILDIKILSLDGESVGDAEASIRDQEVRLISLIMKIYVANKPLSFNSLPDIKTALDFFVGYLMLDCFISNQDRHSQNWGYIVDRDNSIHLCPTFDHASSMGFNLSDEEKAERLSTKDRGRQVDSFVRRARSCFYRKGERLKTLEAFQAFADHAPKAAQAWVRRLTNLTEEQIAQFVSSVPENRMSQTTKDFTAKLLMSNRRRIIEAFSE